MKILITLILAIICFDLTYAQPIATTFEDAESQGISIEILESTYKNAAHYEPQKGVFKERQTEFLSEYRNLHITLGQYLSDHGFEWPETTKLFTRVYFDSSGTIDYFLINPGKANLSENETEKYFSLLNEFIQNYQLPISADIGFAQCSPVKYVANKEEK